MKIDGVDLRQLNRQPTGGTLEQLEDGSWKGNVVFYCLWRLVFTLQPRKNITAHPDFTHMICSRVKVAQVKPKVAKLTVEYTGNPERDESGGIPGDEKIEEFQQAVNAEPIETHPDFAEFGVAANGAKFDSDGLFLGFSEPPSGGEDFRGVTDYLEVAADYSQAYVTRTKPTSLVGISKIDTPDGAPAVEGDYNWLKTGIGWRRSGGIFNVTESWQLSGRKGWNSTIYEST